jgi:hypothetical protein
VAKWKIDGSKMEFFIRKIRCRWAAGANRVLNPAPGVVGEVAAFANTGLETETVPSKTDRALSSHRVLESVSGLLHSFGQTAGTSPEGIELGCQYPQANRASTGSDWQQVQPVLFYSGNGLLQPTLRSIKATFATPVSEFFP